MPVLGWWRRSRISLTNKLLSAPGQAWARGKGSLATVKMCIGTLRVSNPARTRLAAIRKRVLGSFERSEGLSVDSEPVGCVIEPRNLFIAGADVVQHTEGNIEPSREAGR